MAKSQFQTCFQFAGLVPYQNAEQNSLVLDIAQTVQSTLWSDISLLATNMADFWINNCALPTEGTT
jgi:hypothetical protein